MTPSAGAVGWRSVLAMAGVVLGLAGADGARAQSFAPRAGALTVRIGAADVLFASSGKFTLAGQPAPGADLKLSNSVTATVEADYYLRPDVSLALIVGVPPETHADGRGALAPLGRLGAVRYGPGVVLAKYHLNAFGRVQPWVGAGVTRMVVFSDTEAAISNLKVHDAWGGAAQAGVEYMVDPHIGIYVGVSHLFLRTHGSGTFSGLPVTAKIALDPTILQSGLSFRF